MAAQPPSYKTLASLSRMNLLYQLQQRGTMTVNDLAEAAGLHHNTAREHLDRLISEGFVTCTAEPRETKGRPRMLYSAASGTDSNTDSVRARKIDAALVRAEHIRRMQPTAPTTQSTQRQFDALDDHLDQAGFDARVSDDQLRVSLRDCPYSEMVREHPEVCGVHFRLIKDVLAQAEGPLRARQLNLIDAPKLCTIDLHHLAPLPTSDEPEAAIAP